MPSRRRRRHSKFLLVLLGLDHRLTKNRSTVNMKVENLDTTTGLPQWETVEPTAEPIQEISEQLKNKDPKAQSADAHPVNNLNQAPPPGVSQVLLDSGKFKDIVITCLHS
jgi:hypothetical protein